MAQQKRSIIFNTSYRTSVSLNSSFNTAAIDLEDCRTVFIAIIQTLVDVPNGIYRLQASVDGTNWIDTPISESAGGAGAPVNIGFTSDGLGARFVRVAYTAGAPSTSTCIMQYSTRLN